MHLVRDWAQTLSKETWDLVLVGLALSPEQRDNGVARASRLRWCAYMIRRLNLLVESIRREAHATNSELLLSVYDLQDITPGAPIQRLRRCSDESAVGDYGSAVGDHE